MIKCDVSKFSKFNLNTESESRKNMNINSVIALGVNFPDQVSSLRKDGYVLNYAETVPEAVELAQQFRCALLFLNDLNFVDALADTELAAVPFIYLASDTRSETEIHAFERGAADVVLPPWQSAVLLRRAAQQVERFNNQADHARLKAQVASLGEQVNSLNLRVFESESQRQQAVNDKRRLENDVRLLQSSTKELEDNVISSFADLLEYRDNETGGHVVRTSQIVGILGVNLVLKSVFSSEVLSFETTDIMAKAAPLHDVGKVGIHDSILLKPGRLTVSEFEEMKQHTTIGGRILKQLLDKMPSQRYLDYAQRIALNHHERWDGSGYPGHRGGDDIPLEARIMSVADVYDALVSDRVYRKAMPREEAIALIKDGSGTQFDPRIIEVFLECEPEIYNFYTQKNKPVRR
jgi:response regulator RpfG family c-di-GMP phosphodiesterase